MSDVASQLVAKGMSAAEAAKKADLFRAAEGALGASGVKRWFVPGRIEFLGKHTDYAGGPSLLCAVERGLCLAAAARSDRLVRVADVSCHETVEFPLSGDIALPDGWPNYVAAVVRRIARNFPEAARGAQIAFASDLPPAAGLSSSSALIVAMFTAIADANQLHEHHAFAALSAKPQALAGYLACVENGQSYGAFAGDRGVGVFGGSEDHTAILCCLSGHLSQYRFCPVTFEQHLPLPPEWTFAIASSGISAEKAGAARDRYNAASLSAQAVLEVWNAVSGVENVSLDAAVRRSPDAPDRIRAVLQIARHPDFSSSDLLRRFEHFFVESQQLVRAAAAAVAARDERALGEVVDRSQQGAERLLGNQVPETMALARSARELGAIAASAFGAGFGGSVWALVPRDEASSFLSKWRTEYVRAFPASAGRSEFFTTGAGPALTPV
jgi:galactokinase